MDFLKSLILGAIEGLTEFLPVSSTGHLIVFSELFDFNLYISKFFIIFIQLGAILSVIFFYRKKLFTHSKMILISKKSKGFFLNILIAFLPAAIIGLIFYEFIKKYLFSPIVVASVLIIGGLIILIFEGRYYSNQKIDKLEKITYLTSLKIGLAQCFAMIPGTSRSGATIIGGVFVGLSRKTATEFSFFLAIPTIFGATIYDLYRNFETIPTNEVPHLLVGFIFSFVFAIITIKLFLNYVSKHSFTPFAYYRIIFGSLILLLHTNGVITFNPM